MERTVLHSDANCFYASVELLHHPELRGKPVAVGGSPENRHGIILTADYVAKKYGVKTGMPIWQARQLCPGITILPPRMDLYLRFSKMANEIYREYSDRVEPYGIDEDWIDVTESASLKGDGEKIAGEISRRMKRELGITVSIGISFNKIYAKLGSDYKKPDAITTMYRREIRRKAWCLPVSSLLYVGPATEKKLLRMGIRTIGELAETEESLLTACFGKIGSVLWSFANGYDSDPVRKENTEAPVRSIGNSVTTGKDLENEEEVKLILYVLAESVASRLRKHGFRCRVVEISIRDRELLSFTRQHRVERATDITGEIAEEAFRIFRANYHWRSTIRSVGLRAADLVNSSYWEQLDLFVSAEEREKRRKADELVDEIRRRFGYFSIQRGLMYCDEELSRLDCESSHTVHPRGYFG